MALPAMRVLVLTQVFRPEMGALSNRLYPMTRHLARHGHEVFVATGMPNYPRGKVFPGYEGRRFMRESLDGASVLRTSYFTTPRNVSKARQLLSYASFLPAALHSGWRAGPVDIVLITSPPLFPALPAILLARARRARLALDLRDLWPDEFVACGVAREGSAGVRLLRLLERWAYHSADVVTCTTRSFVDTVVNRGVDRERIRLLPNGADLDVFRPLPADNAISTQLGVDDRFVVMYSGLLGIKHGLETIVDAASELQAHEDIVFVIVGDGPRRADLERRLEELRLTNVMLVGERPTNELPYLLARADVCVTNLLAEPYLEEIIPTKLFEYMACAKPVVGGLAGEGSRLLVESGGGVVVPPGDSSAMASAILELRKSPRRRAEMGRAGKDHVARHYSRSAIAAQLETILLEVAGSRKPHSAPSEIIA
jgi:glycosyltransferase involved in cell wall biosynthesis